MFCGCRALREESIDCGKSHSSFFARVQLDWAGGHGNFGHNALVADTLTSWVVKPMIRKPASIGWAIPEAILAFVAMLREVSAWLLKNYGGIIQMVLLLLFVYALLSAPIVVAWIVGVKP